MKGTAGQDYCHQAVRGQFGRSDALAKDTRATADDWIQKAVASDCSLAKSNSSSMLCQVKHCRGLLQ